jgi:hypothetical protein
MTATGSYFKIFKAFLVHNMVKDDYGYRDIDDCFHVVNAMSDEEVRQRVFNQVKPEDYDIDLAAYLTEKGMGMDVTCWFSLTRGVYRSFCPGCRRSVFSMVSHGGNTSTGRCPLCSRAWRATWMGRMIGIKEEK